jgi:hypothetical protein
MSQDSNNSDNSPPDASARPMELPQQSSNLVMEFWDFIRFNKAWWMTPIILVLLAMVAFILWAESSPVLPFIYTL